MSFGCLGAWIWNWDWLYGLSFALVMESQARYSLLFVTGQDCESLAADLLQRLRGMIGDASFSIVRSIQACREQLCMHHTLDDSLLRKLAGIESLSSCTEQSVQ